MLNDSWSNYNPRQQALSQLSELSYNRHKYMREQMQKQKELEQQQKDAQDEAGQNWFSSAASGALTGGMLGGPVGAIVGGLGGAALGMWGASKSGGGNFGNVLTHPFGKKLNPGDIPFQQMLGLGAALKGKGTQNGMSPEDVDMANAGFEAERQRRAYQGQNYMDSSNPFSSSYEGTSPLASSYAVPQGTRQVYRTIDQDPTLYMG